MRWNRPRLRAQPYQTTCYSVCRKKSGKATKTWSEQAKSKIPNSALHVQALLAGSNSQDVSPLGDGVDIIPPPSGQKFISVDSNGLSAVRTPGQVLYLAYGNVANVTSGGFFPTGVNGKINMSSEPA